jgi:hypothetical protein
MRRRIKKLTALFVVLALGVGWPIVLHYRAKSRLARYEAGLKSAGEKLTIDELAPTPVPEAFNAALDLVSITSFLGTKGPSGTNFPPVMKYAGPGKAVVGWQQPVLPNNETTNVWPGLRQEIESSRQTITAIRGTIGGAPAVALDLDYRPGWSMLLPHLAKLRSAGRWLAVASEFDLHEERVSDALEELQALVELASKQGHEPVQIIELVRTAICAMAVGTTWEALQSSACSETNLSALQSSWEAVELLAQAESVLAMERAFATKGYTEARASANSAGSCFSTGSPSAMAELGELGKEVLENPRAGLRAFFGRYPGYWVWRWWQSFDDELADAQTAQAGIEAVRKARREKILGPALKQFEEDSLRIRQAHPRAGRWFGYSTMAGTQIFLNRIMLLEIQRSLVVTAIALKRYRNAHDAYPEKLELLVPEYLSALPRDPVDGQPLRYKLNMDGSFCLYSVGEDGVDNGGDASLVPGASKNWTHGRDVVWPAPANAEETKEVLGKMPPKQPR